MPLVSHKSAPASCGHVQTGSSRVFVQGNGVSRVEVDTAGGLIIGPGSQNVFVENIKVSLVGDAIASHGKSPHSSARTTSTQQKVFVGTGFAGDSASTGSSLNIQLKDSSLTDLLGELKDSYFPKLSIAESFIKGNYVILKDLSGNIISESSIKGNYVIVTDLNGDVISEVKFKK